ncbi:MAG: PKD domain-containing protein, partial [Anaerolineae bacterium]
LATVVNNIRIQNRAPTPIPSATPNIPRPIAAFNQDRSAGQAPLIVRFLNQSSGNISSYFWTFGDGGSSTDANPIYTFRSPGIFNVTLNVAGPGGTSNVSQQINVQSPNAPIAAFSQDKTTGPSPLTVKFTNQSTGTISTYNWTFGDGSPVSSEQNPTHQFIAVGTYNIILSVTGPGGTSFVTRKITVEDPVIPPPVAAFTPNKTSGDSPLEVQFADQSTGQITNYAWDFGDGQTSADKNPLHSFVSTGTFIVKLTAIGPGGQSSTQSVITVTTPPDAPIAAFTQNTTSGNIPLAIQFTNQSTGNITSYAWDFGDGQTSVEKDPSHTYSSIGTFTVKLLVTGPGGSKEAQSTITATQPIAAPVAAFTTDVSDGTAPLTVQFANSSTGENVSYTWDFGDGSLPSNEVSPVHVYTTAGSYLAKLTASNGGGSSEATQSITVNAPAAQPPPINRELAFVSDRSGNSEIYLLTTDGTTINLTNDFASDTNPAWSPDGSRIAFVSNRSGANEIYIMNGDGSNVQQVTFDNAENNLPVWARNGAQIVFVSNKDGNNELYSINLDGTNATNLTNNPANDTSPAYSPDGNGLAFMSDRDTGNNEIWLLNADGSTINLTNNPTIDAAPSWSPDGTEIVFVSDRDLLAQIFIMNADGSNPRRLSDATSIDTAPNWTVNSSQIAFVSQRDGISQIYAMDTNGNNLARVSDGSANDTSPAWKP